MILTSVLTARTGGGLWPVGLLAGLVIVWLSISRSGRNGQPIHPSAGVALVFAMAFSTLLLAGGELHSSGGIAALGFLATGVPVTVTAALTAGRRPNSIAPLLLVLAGVLLVGLGGIASTDTSDATLAHDVAGERVLEGRSPWRDLGVPESNPYRMGEIIDGYSYPPPTLLVFGLVGTLLPDIRFLVVVLWSLVVLAAYRLYPQQSGWLPSSLVLIPGYSLAVEQSWTEPLTVLLVLMSLGLARRPFPGGFVWGLAVASKQYMLVGLAGLIPIARRHRSFVAGISLGLLVGLIPVAFDLSGAWQALVSFHAERPVRPDSSNLTGWVALVSARTDWALPPLAALGAAAMVGVWAAWRRRDTSSPWLPATTAALATSLVAGPVSLPNYWIAVTAFVLLMVAEDDRSATADPVEATTADL